MTDRKETSSFKSVSQNYINTWPHRSLDCLELKYLFSQQKCHQGTLPPAGAEVPWAGSAPRETQQGEPSGVSGRIELATSYLVTSKWKVLLSENPVHSLGNTWWKNQWWQPEAMRYCSSILHATIILISVKHRTAKHSSIPTKHM